MYWPASETNVSRSFPGELVVSVAKTFDGVPFRHQGNTRAGVDCAGLVIAVARQIGACPDFDLVSDYPKEPSGYKMANILKKYLLQSNRNRLAPGHILLFSWSKYPHHAGIYIGDMKFIHAYEPAGKVIVGRYSLAMQRMTRGFFEFPANG